MAASRTALITGITGQDGSYLAEHLLSLGYRVCGVVRRSASENFWRINHLRDDVELIQADLLDQSSLDSAVRGVKPDEVYNLAAQSFVPASWEQPLLTAEFTAVGVTRVLEAIRKYDDGIRFYQASSSEMFGKVREVPQTELTPFHPRSPYGCAKTYGHFITVNYRESYGLHASCGILFNHECVTAETPVFVRRDGIIDLLPIEDVVPHRTSPHTTPRSTTVPSDGLEVWDAEGWAPVTCMTATWNGYEKKPNKKVVRVAARGAVFQATEDHIVFMGRNGSSGEKRAGDVMPGERLTLIDLPQPTEVLSMTEDEGWLLGILAAEGYVSDDGHVSVANQDEALLDAVRDCWRRVRAGAAKKDTGQSGFENGREVFHLRLTGANAYGRLLREELYTRSGHKRIPRRVLNAGIEARMGFLRGVNVGDGLRSTPCQYEFQGFKTSSAVLAAGLYWMALTTLDQRAIICPEERGDRLYYQVNLNSPEVVGAKGQHLRRPLEEVTAVGPSGYKGWLYDLATSSGTFHAGVGQGWVHNSPRRGLEFVTRKITHEVARVKHGLSKELLLGNLEAKRDWGYAADYVRAMHLMLQQDDPDDFVIATGETHSVQEFVEVAFAEADLDWQDYVKQDERFMRPAEVDLLVGAAAKAGAKLGWRPTVDFRGLVKLMVEADLEWVERQKRKRAPLP